MPTRILAGGCPAAEKKGVTIDGVTFIKDLDLRTKSAIKNKSAFRLHEATLFLREIFWVGWLGVHRASQAGFSLILTAGARV